MGTGGCRTYSAEPNSPSSSALNAAKTSVRSDSPAERAGVRAGDVIVRFGGLEVRTLEDLTFQLRARRPGDEVQVVVVRDGREQTVRAVLSERR